jgi:hypothetical protein
VPIEGFLAVNLAKMCIQLNKCSIRLPVFSDRIDQRTRRKEEVLAQNIKNIIFTFFLK